MVYDPLISQSNDYGASNWIKDGILIWKSSVSCFTLMKSFLAAPSSMTVGTEKTDYSLKLDSILSSTNRNSLWISQSDFFMRTTAEISSWFLFKFYITGLYRIWEQMPLLFLPVRLEYYSMPEWRKNLLQQRTFTHTYVVQQYYTIIFLCEGHLTKPKAGTVHIRYVPLSTCV